MRKNLQTNVPSARLTGLSLTLLLLILAVSCSGCAAPRQPSPPVLFKPSRVQAPDPELMRSPLPAGMYSSSVKTSLSGWESRQKALLLDFEGSKPGPDPQ